MKGFRDIGIAAALLAAWGVTAMNEESAFVSRALLRKADRGPDHKEHARPEPLDMTVVWVAKESLLRAVVIGDVRHKDGPANHQATTIATEEERMREFEEAARRKMVGGTRYVR